MYHTLSFVRLLRFALIAFIAVSALFITSRYAFADSTYNLMPGADGAYAQWTPKTGTSHYTMVDETTCNGTTDYNSTTVVGNRDSYVVSTSSIPNAATITQIDIRPCASRALSGGAAPVMNVFYRLNGVNSADSGSYSLSGTNPTNLATTTFSGLALIKSATNTLEVGAVLSSGTKGARLSRIATIVTYTPLAAPTSLVATATTTSAVGLTWTDNASSTETGYSIERSLNALSWTGIASTSANVTSYYDSGLSSGTTYYYRVRAFNSGGYSAFSNTASTTTSFAPPNAPSDLTAVASSTARKVVASWFDNSTDETSFELVRSTDGSLYTHLATTSASTTTYVDTSVATSTTYFYQVRSFNSIGYSAFSNVATTITYDIPAAPTDLTLTLGTSGASTTVTLDWVDNAFNELTFDIERSIGTSSFSHYATTSMDVTTYVDYFSVSTDVSYRVRAYNGGGYSAFSNVATTTTFNVPAAPTDLELTLSIFGTSTLVTLDWVDNAFNELSFDIQRSIGTSTFTHYATTTANTTTFNDWFFTSGVDVAYRVRAYNGYGFSVFTNTAATTTP